MTTPVPGSPSWYGEDFPAGHSLRVRMDVLEARPMASKPHVGLVRSRWTVRNQQDVPVMTMAGWGMFRRRPAADAQPA